MWNPLFSEFFTTNRRGRTHQSSVEPGLVLQLGQNSVVSFARVEPVAQTEDWPLELVAPVALAESRPFATAALVALAELAALVEGKPSVLAMACQLVAEAKVAVRFRLVSRLVVAQPFDSLEVQVPVPCQIRSSVLAMPVR